MKFSRLPILMFFLSLCFAGYGCSEPATDSGTGIGVPDSEATNNGDAASETNGGENNSDSSGENTTVGDAETESNDAASPLPDSETGDASGPDGESGTDAALPEDTSALEDVSSTDTTETDADMSDTEETNVMDVGEESGDTTEESPDASQGDAATDTEGETETAECTPGETLCTELAESLCNENGTWLDPQPCEGDEVCLFNKCSTLCENLPFPPGHEGCSFTAITTSNPSLAEAFQEDFAVVVSNRQSNPNGSLVIRQGETVLVEESIVSGETLTFTFPMVEALSGAASGSVVASDAAYRIETTVPVTALQFSPLHFELEEKGSLTNDASLLLPHHGLSGNYLMSGFPAWGKVVTWRSPFIAFSATADATEVTVTASTDIAEGPGVNAMAAGEQQTFTLNAGDVVQLLAALPADEPLTETSCPLPWLFEDFGFPDTYCLAPDLDLSGTSLSATAPLAVFSGHSCLQLPFTANACDHAEEQLLPVETWGDDYYLTAPMRPDGDGVMEVTYRVLAENDETTITITPQEAGPVVLNAGEGFTFSSASDLHLLADKPVLVIQALHGAYGVDPPAINEAGDPLSDPAITTMVPQRQARDEYFFLVPDTYESDWLNVVTFTGTEVLLDGVPIDGWSPVGDSGYSVTRIQVEAGGHRIWTENDVIFTINSYGFARHTSYMYPGGLSLMQ